MNLYLIDKVSSGFDEPVEYHYGHSCEYDHSEYSFKIFPGEEA